MSKYEGVHSCGPNCTQPLCVANRRIEELTADRDDIRRKYIAEAKETDRLQAKVEDADRQRSILQTNLDAETTRGNVLDRENERLQATAEVLEKYLKDALHLLFKSEGE